MANTYDFYKPKMESEYPEVDGPVSVVTYIAALDAAYGRYKEKCSKSSKHGSINASFVNGSRVNGIPNGDVGPKSPLSLEDFDYAIFHSPYGKQAVKGHARMLYNDFVSDPSNPKFSSVPSSDTILASTYPASLTDKTIEKTFISAAKSLFQKQTEPAMACSRRLGNMYTGSLYGGLASLISSVEPAQLKAKRVSLFAFGSGCAASFFTLRIKGDTSEIKEKMDLINRLASMKVVPCQEFVDALTVSVVPTSNRSSLLRYSSCVKNITMLRRIPRKDLSMASGQVRTTWRPSTISTGGNIPGRRSLDSTIASTFCFCILLNTNLGPIRSQDNGARSITNIYRKSASHG
jgi:hydroxymethylglutaryl-CoA synthase